MMKKLLLISTVLLSTQLAYAGGGERPHFKHRELPSVEQRVERMSKMLDLTDEQAVQITAIMNSRDEEMKNLMSSMKELREQQREDISAVLTDEQKEKLSKRFSKHHKHTQPDYQG